MDPPLKVTSHAQAEFLDATLQMFVNDLSDETAAIAERGL
jgi:hypothetical protein